MNMKIASLRPLHFREMIAIHLDHFLGFVGLYNHEWKDVSQNNNHPLSANVPFGRILSPVNMPFFTT